MNLHEQVTIPPGQGVSTPVAHSASLAAGTSLGDYDLLEELGRGGMGVVFKARQKSLNRLVAVKMILAGRLASPQDVKRFQAEAEAAAALDHPGIIPIYEVDEVGGQHFFSMAYVEGENLAARVRMTPMLPRLAAEVLGKLADAVEYAHQRGIIHRDLKPGNVLMDASGNPRITDFGLAKRVSPGDTASSSGDVCGTVSYMPPEQAEGQADQLGPPTDVYALGATLYCLLTGRPPFQSANPLDTLLQVVQQEPVPPRQLNGSIPVDLETICLKCLQKEPQRRYLTAALLGDDLQRFLRDEPVLARPPSSWEQLRRWSRRHPGLAVSMLISGAAVASLLLVSVWYNFLLQSEKLAAQAAGLESRRLQQSTQLLLQQVADLRKSGRALNALRYADFGRQCALTHAIASASTLEETERLRGILSTELRSWDSTGDLGIRGVVAKLSSLLAEPPVSGDPRWQTAATELTSVCRDAWLADTAAIPAVRDQVRRVTTSRFVTLATDLTRDSSSDDREQMLEQLRTLYRGELAVVASSEIRTAADAFMEWLNPSSKPPTRAEMRTAVAALRTACTNVVTDSPIQNAVP